MSAAQLNNPVQRFNLKWLAVAVVASLVGAGVLWLGSSQDQQQPAPLASMAPTHVAAAPPVISASNTPALLNTPAMVTQQTAAATAAAQQVGVKPVAGHIAERPDFVSALEWQVLKAVAARSPDSDKELTRLVSNMRFNKQVELWQSMANSPEPEQRHALATQLLGDIPRALKNSALDVAEAQKLQQALVSDLIPDPQLRQQRLAQEAQRIGVESDIEASSGVTK